MMYKLTIKQTAKIKAEPNGGADTIGSLAAGTVIYSDLKQGQWFHLVNMRGWVSSGSSGQYLTWVEVDEPQPEPPPVEQPAEYPIKRIVKALVTFETENGALITQELT